MEKQELILRVLDRVERDVAADVVVGIVEATLQALFEAEQVNAVRCPCCRTRIATVADLEAPLQGVA